jgi:prepilin-type N-terminal cleavage/methylation domain-containing protein
MLNKRKGFTLIELLVVIAIIGVLASVVLTSLIGARKRARDIRTISQLTQICKAIEIYHIETGHYPYVGCSFSGESSGVHFGKYRDNPNNDPYGDEIFDILQKEFVDAGLVPRMVSIIPNDPAADYPANNWSYFYDNYYDSAVPENTPETSECTNQSFQLLGYVESETPPSDWEAAWGFWEGKGWWRACKGF